MPPSELMADKRTESNSPLLHKNGRDSLQPALREAREILPSLSELHARGEIGNVVVPGSGCSRTGRLWHPASETLTGREADSGTRARLYKRQSEAQSGSWPD